MQAIFKKIVNVEGDVDNFPFEEQQFGIVHYHMVRMATPDPKAATKCLGATVKKGDDLFLKATLGVRVRRLKKTWLQSCVG